MKKLLSVLMVMVVLLELVAQSNGKEERIKRDVEVAKNVLSTLIRQQLERKNSFWPLEVKGSYTAGYGVTLRVPMENWSFGFDYSAPVIWSGDDSYDKGVTVISRDRSREEIPASPPAKEAVRAKRAAVRDSARIVYGDKILEASKTFLADYGDLIGLEPGERILITTKSERDNHNGFVFYADGGVKSPKRKVISVEVLKSDLTAYRQNKISREQLVTKFKILNSEVENEVSPDLELLSTIFNRLYRSDLSKTYFTENPPYYERMKDFGVTFYMQVYSSNEAGYKRWNMPTADLSDLSQEERDKKVIEMYPAFEKDIKENILEYGRTLNSLKDEELFILDVTLTRCKGCNIPSSVEFSVKASVLKEFGSGKLSKDAALTRINVKNGTPQ